MEDDEKYRGIDFFDFLAEAWRRKLAVVAILLVCTGGFWLLRTIGQSEPTPTKDPTHVGRVEFFIAETDPMGRSAATINADLVSRFAEKMGNDADPKRSDVNTVRDVAVIYSWGFDQSANFGAISLTSADRIWNDKAVTAIEEAVAEQIADSLIEVRKRKAITEAAAAAGGVGVLLRRDLVAYDIALSRTDAPVKIYRKISSETPMAAARKPWSPLLGGVFGVILAAMYVAVDVARLRRRDRAAA